MWVPGVSQGYLVLCRGSSDIIARDANLGSFHDQVKTLKRSNHRRRHDDDDEDGETRRRQRAVNITKAQAEQSQTIAILQMPPSR